MTLDTLGPWPPPPKPLPSHVGEEIKALMRERNINPVKTLELAGRDRQEFLAMLAGTAPLSADMAELLEPILRVGRGYLAKMEKRISAAARLAEIAAAPAEVPEPPPPKPAPKPRPPRKGQATERRFKPQSPCWRSDYAAAK